MTEASNNQSSSSQVLKSKKLTQVNFNFKAMGSPCEIRIYATSHSEAANLISQACQDIERLENKYSRYLQDNLLFRVNEAARLGESIEIDDEFESLLNYADTCYQQSEGLFDITSGSLRKVWNFKEAIIPTQAQIDQCLESIGWQHVKRSKNKLQFTRKNMELDFGGIVKEYAVDTTAAILQNAGIQHGLVDLGGDIKIIGPHPNNDPWRVHIRHPRKEGVSIAAIDIGRGAIASSGDYERKIEIDGKRYGHIISPQTGWPVTGVSAVSVVSSQCVIAGSACTIAMLQEEHAATWLEDLGLPYLSVATDGSKQAGPTDKDTFVWLE